MTTTTTFRPLLVQHGVGTFIAWTDYEVDIGSQVGVQSYAVSATKQYSQVYDFGLTFDSERGLPIGNDVFFANVANTFTVTLETSRTSVPAASAIWFSNILAQPLWTTGISTADSVLLELFTSSSDAWQLNSNGTTYDFSFDIDMNATYTGNARDVTIMSNFRDSRWQGKFALVFAFGGTDVLVRDPTAYDRGFLSSQHVPIHTGWENRPATRGRPVTDMRSGKPAFAQDLQEDGFINGIWTSSRNWDPDDPRNIRPVEFPPDESLKDDDVPV